MPQRHVVRGDGAAEPRDAEPGQHLDRTALLSYERGARLAEHTRGSDPPRGASGPHGKPRPHLDGLGVETPGLERGERVGRRRRQQEIGAGRVDLGLQWLGQLRAQATVEYPIPRPADRIGAGEGTHVDGGRR